MCSGTHVRSNLCHSICLRHLIMSRAVTNGIFFYENICYTLSQTNSQSKQHQFVPFLLARLVVRIPLWDQMITFPISNNWFVQFMEAIRGGCYLWAPGYNVNIVTVSWICINFIILTVSVPRKSFNSSHVFQGDLASIKSLFSEF